MDDLGENLQPSRVQGIDSFDVSQPNNINVTQFSPDEHTEADRGLEIHRSTFLHETSTAIIEISSTIRDSSPSFWTHASPASFMTSPSTVASPSSCMNGSPASFMTASPGAMDMHSPGSVLATVPEEEQVNTEFQSLVSAKGLILPPEEELNWSGKGQHVEFLFDHEIPLEFIAAVAASPKAMVEKVRCQRIILARKTMRCSRGWTLKDALLEVEHLNRLRHTHIIQMVGSYLSGRKFSILLYPAADCDLGTFLENTQDLLLPRALGLDTQYYSRKRSLQKSLRCIAQALKYIHAENTKHMDIKPANILVKLSSSPSEWWAPYKIYISDFGISKNFEDLGYSQTDGPTARSVKYCAPEVFSQDIRGRAADVFRWDACFAEILTVLGQKSLDAFADFRADNSPNSAMAFHASTYAATAWVKTLSQRVMFPPVDWPIERNLSMLPDLLESMLRQIPAERPTANSIALKLDNNFGTFNCCSAGSEAYTIEPPSS